jgi:hypothetical protein
MTVTIYGSSDDLIEVGGDLDEEYSVSEDDPAYLAFSDGTVLQVIYTLTGFWHVDRLRIGTASYEKVDATDADNDYSDRVTLDGDLTWVVIGSSFSVARARR